MALVRASVYVVGHFWYSSPLMLSGKMPWKRCIFIVSFVSISQRGRSSSNLAIALSIGRYLLTEIILMLLSALAALLISPHWVLNSSVNPASVVQGMVFAASLTSCVVLHEAAFPSHSNRINVTCFFTVS